MFCAGIRDEHPYGRRDAGDLQRGLQTSILLSGGDKMVQERAGAGMWAQTCPLGT